MRLSPNYKSANRESNGRSALELQIGQHSAEVGDSDPVLRQTLDHLGHKVVAFALKRELGVSACYGFHRWNRAQAFFRDRVVGGQQDRPLRTMAAHQILGPATLDNPPG